MNWKITMLILTAFAVLLSDVTEGAVKKKNKAPAETKAKSEYDKLFSKPHKIAKGFITLHQVGQKLYFELPKTLLGKDMMLAVAISRTSDNSVGVPGQKNQNPMRVRFSVRDSIVFLSSVSSIWEIRHSESMKLSLEDNRMDAVLYKFPVITESKDKNHVVFDATKFFCDEIQVINPLSHVFSLFGVVSVSQKLRKDMATVDDIKSFDENLTIRTTFNYNVDVKVMGQVYLKDIPMSVQAARSLVLLPETLMARRLADPRINYFQTAKTIFAPNDMGAETEAYINRWRLEPKDMKAWSRGELVEPEKPIVYYLDNAFPESWRESVREGVLVWNKAFEKIGFKNAVQVKDFPADDPAFDPDNMKYSCIRYSTSMTANAMGPSWVDPRTGEIINATLHLYHNIAQVLNDWRFIQTAQLDERVRDKKLPEDLFLASLKYVVSHEVGHTLGLMHNMAASVAIPTDSLRSVTYTKKYGTTVSIMDYARYNYVAQPEDKGVTMTPPELGEYDYFSIHWGYAPIEAKDYLAEKKTLDKWITEKGDDPVYRYGKQEISGKYDPDAALETLGDDMMKANAYGIKNLKFIMKHLPDWVIKEGEDYTALERYYKLILQQYNAYLAQPYLHLGGYTFYETVGGDGRPAYIPVPKEKQKAALDFMMTQIKDMDWLIDKRVVTHLMVKPNALKDLRSAIMNILLDPGQLARINDCASVSDDPYSLKEYMSDLYGWVWKPSASKSRLSSVEMDFQKQFVKSMLTYSGLMNKEQPRLEGLAGLQSAEEVLAYASGHPRAFEKEILKLVREERENVVLDPYYAGFELKKIITSNTGAKNGEIYFSLLQKIRKLLAQKVKTTSDPETLVHYRYVLHELKSLMDGKVES